MLMERKINIMIEQLKKIPFQTFLATITVLCCFGFFFYISSSLFPPAMVKEISDIKIALITVLSTVMGYYFGGAKSKQQQSEINKTT